MAWRATAVLAGAWQGQAWHGGAGQGKDEDERGDMRWHISRLCLAWPGEPRLGLAWLGLARKGEARMKTEEGEI